MVRELIEARQTALLRKIGESSAVHVAAALRSEEPERSMFMQEQSFE
ncbi:MAG: hypothetical protein IRZ24_10430 [Thermogemmatispora sp.]|nr:hypothetical protein [Thermogemmatispora sp.]MBX5450474.1 hypothetical protein [Thermogemmatispora sp.]